MAFARGNGAPRGIPGFSVPRLYNPYDDTFDGSTLNPKWILSGTTPGPSVSGGACSFSSLGAGRHIYQSIADNPLVFTLYARISALSTVAAMTGLFATDSAGVGVGASTYNGPGGTYSWQLATGTVYNITGNVQTFVAVDMWLKLRRNGPLWYVAAASHDASKNYLTQPFGPETTAISMGNTITRIGFGSFFNTCTATLEEFRCVLG